MSAKTPELCYEGWAMKTATAAVVVAVTARIKS